MHRVVGMSKYPHNGGYYLLTCECGTLYRVTVYSIEYPHQRNRYVRLEEAVETHDTTSVTACRRFAMSYVRELMPDGDPPIVICGGMFRRFDPPRPITRLI
jgi:hypothetical protein